MSFCPRPCCFISGPAGSTGPTGAAGGVAIANRRNHSVNGGACDNFTLTPCIMRTNTTVNNVGAFNGGGNGNKAILGHWLYSSIPLSMLTSVVLDYERLTPEISLGQRLPSFVFVVEFEPISFPGVYSLLTCGDETNVALNVGTYSTPSPGVRRISWTSGANYIQVVGDKGVGGAGFPPPVSAGPDPIPTAQGPSPGTIPPPSTSWTIRAYALADLLIAHPNARIVNASSGDGGLPKNTQTAGVMIALGDSGTIIQNAIRILAWSFNGTAI